MHDYCPVRFNTASSGDTSPAFAVPPEMKLASLAHNRTRSIERGRCCDEDSEIAKPRARSGHGDSLHNIRVAKRD
jgi:hypothetical protein